MASGSQEYLMKVKLELEAKQLEAELKRVQGKIEGIGGGKTTTLANMLGDAQSQWGGFGTTLDTIKGKLGDIPVPAIAAAGAITGLGVAAYGAGKELYDLAKQGADFGRSLGSFEAKTGLSAQAVSALAYAANISGKELSDMQRPLVAFARYVEKTGGDVHNLEGEFDKAIKTLNKMPDGIEKMNRSGEMFGKKGGLDMISIAKKMPDGFREMQREAERLGVTLSEDDVRAAKEFGRAYDIVGMQVKVGVSRFALTYAPMITGALKDISDSLAHNQDAWKRWGMRISDTIDVVIKSFKGWAGALEDLQQNHPNIYAAMFLSSPLAVAGSAWNSSIDDRMRNDYKVVHSKYDKPLPGTKGDGISDDGEDGVQNPKGRSGARVRDKFKLSSDGQALVNAANKIGVSPLDLATIIGFETGGTYSPATRNTQGYQGLIQFSPSIQGKYTTGRGESFEHQVQNGVVRYFQDRGLEPGSDLLTMYRTVLGGNPHASLTATDANGTSALSGVRRMTQEHRPQALKRFFGGSEGNARGDGSANEIASAAAAIKKEQQEEVEGAQQVAEQWVASMQHAMDQELSLRRATSAKSEEILRGQLAAGEIDEQKYIQEIGSMKVKDLERERDLLRDQIMPESDKQNKIAQINLQIETEKLKTETDILEIYRKQREEVEHAQKKNQRPTTTLKKRHPHDIGEGTLGSIEHGAGVGLVPELDADGRVKSSAERLKGVYADVKDFAGGAIGSMVQGLADLGLQWLMTGDISKKAALGMLAASAMHIASEAGMKALFEVAEAWAAAGRHDYKSAHDHTAAAVIYGKVALVAGAVGVGAALGARSAGGGSATGGGSGGSGYSNSQQNQRPYTRTNDAVWMSGNPTRRENQLLAAAIDRLNSNLDTARPGDVLVKGMREKPGAVGEQTVRDWRSNSSQSRNAARTMGIG